MIDPVSPAVPSCDHLFILLAEDLIFPSHKATSSDIGEGYEVGAGPIRGSGVSSGCDFPHQREALEPGGSLRAQWVLAFLAESDGELHKGNSITRLVLSLLGKLLPVGCFFFF